MKISYLFLAAVVVLSACSKSRKAPNGLEINVVKEGAGEVAKPGEFLVMSMLYKDDKDSIWNDTRKSNIPVIIMVPDTSAIKSEKGIESCFRALKKGDSVTVKVTAKSLFENTWQQQLPPNVKPETMLTFVLGVNDVTDRAGFEKIREEQQAKLAEKDQAMRVAQLGIDTTAIDTYLASKKITAQTDPSGLRYVITKLGKGAKPLVSSTVKVNYKGMLLENGTPFDQSNAPVEFPLSNLIQGWQIGFQLLPKGSAATLYVPSSLGYGANGYGNAIPPNANLIFEVELIDFK